MSDTPRTSEAAGMPSTDWEATAERLFKCSATLERELDYAHAASGKLSECLHEQIQVLERELNEANASHAETVRLAQQLKDDLVATERERDDLRTKLQHANEAALRAMNSKVQLIADNAALIEENNRLHKELQALKEK